MNKNKLYAGLFWYCVAMTVVSVIVGLTYTVFEQSFRVFLATMATISVFVLGAIVAYSYIDNEN